MPTISRIGRTARQGPSKGRRPVREVLSAIAHLPDDWHGAGLMSMDALHAIARLVPRRVRFSVETGSGRSTLLLSHLSERHVVFAVDDGSSISNVRASPLLRSDVVTFIEGPSQLTLANHRFDTLIDLALAARLPFS